MFNRNDSVILIDGVVGIIVGEAGEGAYRVNVDGKILTVSEFDIVPNDLDDDSLAWLDDEDDELWEDLQPYRDLNQSYY